MTRLAVGTRIIATAEDLDHLLRGEGRHSTRGSKVPVGALCVIMISSGLLHGAVLGAFGGKTLQALYTAIKLPILLGVTTAICLPSFHVFNTLLGRGEDFPACLRGILAAQATLALALVSSAPITAFVYASGCSYHFAILFNGGMFALATLSGQLVLSRHWQPLIARAPRHRASRLFWVTTYIFVATQMAWVLRPFVGTGGLATTFFRADSWDNAYVKVATICWRWLVGDLK